MQNRYISYSSSNRPGLLQKAGAVVATVAVVGVAVMFSAVLLAGLLVVVVFGGAYLWWKTREVRKLMKAQMQDLQARSATVQGETFKGETFEGEVIEGEVIRVEKSQDR
jgi:hypothetical protein